MDMVEIILAIVFAVVLILAIYIPASSTKRYDKLATKYIKDGLQSGIKDVSYPSHHTIDITFYNGVRITDAWNANKYYSWLNDGTITFKGYMYNYHNRPKISILKKLDKAIDKFTLNYILK